MCDILIILFIYTKMKNQFLYLITYIGIFVCKQFRIIFLLYYKQKKKDGGITMRETREIRKEENEFYEEVNKACVSGVIEEKFEYSHTCFGKKFYKSYAIVKRFSDRVDRIPIIAFEQLIGEEAFIGKFVKISGKFCSHNRMDKNGCGHLDLFLLANKIDIYEEEMVVGENYIFLDGYLCKPPVYRKTPTGGDYITEVFIAVNRKYGKTDYIPCIAWNKKAQKVSEFNVGQRVSLFGRIQSRRYFKKDEQGGGEYREINEISIFDIQKI